MKFLKYALLLILLLFVFGVAYHWFTGVRTQDSQAVDTTSNVSLDENVVDEAPFELDFAAAIKPRILGDTSAPIRISEHSSFTCSHCGKFHKLTFDEFKANYIDTGKAYLVFSDFPLNAPALHASMIGRCLPVERYFDYVDHLFKEQEKWAYDTNYLNFLKKTAANYGLGENGFKACLNNEDLREALISTMKSVQAQWDVNSTPSFVVNNKTVLNGALDYATFSAKIEEAVNGKSNVAVNTETPTAQTIPVTDTGTKHNTSEQEAVNGGEDAQMQTTEKPTALEELKSDIQTLKDETQDALEKTSAEATQEAITSETAEGFGATEDDIEAVEDVAEEAQEKLEDAKEALEKAEDIVEEALEETQNIEPNNQ